MFCSVETKSGTFPRGLDPGLAGVVLRGGKGGGPDNRLGVVTGTGGGCIESGKGGGASVGGGVDMPVIAGSKKSGSNGIEEACTCDGATVGVA